MKKSSWNLWHKRDGIILTLDLIFVMINNHFFLGISQLRKLDSFVKRRREIADIYHKAFRGNPYFDIPDEKDCACSSYHLYPIRIKDKYKDKKREIFLRLREKGLGVQVHYMPVYLQPYYKDLGYKRGYALFQKIFITEK